MPDLVGYEAFPGGPIIADVELDLIHFYSPNNGAVTVRVLDDSLSQLDKQSYAPTTTVNEGTPYLLNFSVFVRAKYLLIETAPSEVGMLGVCVD